MTHACIVYSQDETQRKTNAFRLVDIDKEQSVMRIDQCPSLDSFVCDDRSHSSLMLLIERTINQHWYIFLDGHDI